MLEGKLQVNKKYRIYYNEGNPNNMDRIEIRAIIDEQEVVYRYYSKRKHYYCYVMEGIYFFKLLFDKGNIEEIKRKGKKDVR